MRYRAALAVVGLTPLVACGDEPVGSELAPYEVTVLSEAAPDALRGEPGFLNDAGEAVWHENGGAVFWDGSSATAVAMTAQDLGSDSRILGIANGTVVLWQDGTFTEVTSDENAAPIGIADGDSRAYFKVFYTSYGDARVWVLDPADGSVEEFGGNSVFPVAFSVGADGDTTIISAGVGIDAVTDRGNVLYAWDTWGINRGSTCAIASSDGEGTVLASEWGKGCFGVEGEDGFYLFSLSAGRLTEEWQMWRGGSEVGNGGGLGIDLNSKGKVVVQTAEEETLLVGKDYTSHVLSDLVNGWTITQVAAINNHDEILAAGIRDGESAESVILLTPR